MDSFAIIPQGSILHVITLPYSLQLTLLVNFLKYELILGAVPCTTMNHEIWLYQ